MNSPLGPLALASPLQRNRPGRGGDGRFNRNPFVGLRNLGGLGLPLMGGGLGGSPSPVLGGGLGGLALHPYARNGFDPLRRYGGHGGMGMGMGMGGIGNLGPIGRADVLSGTHLGLGALLLGGQSPAPDYLRAMSSLPLNDPFLARLNALPMQSYPDILRYGAGLGRCDGRGCHGGLGCGYNRRCEHDRCMIDCSRCSSSSGGGGGGGGSASSTKELKTKDVVIRGKVYKIRKSFLADSHKFESEVVKLLDKKSEESMPNNVVQMLIDFINVEKCAADSLLDLVSMNVLASSLNVKSAVEHSLNLLKKYEVDYSISGPELTQICVTILSSSKVDDKLTEWLKKYLKYERRFEHLDRNPFWLDTIEQKPQLYRQVGQLLGLLEKDDDDKFRVI